MQRVKTSTAVAVLPADPAGGTPGYFAQPNPGGGVPATVPSYEWYNNMQEEICAIILAAGITLDGANRAQLLAALRSAGVFTTPAQFDNTTKAATTAFVRASGLQSSAIPIVTATGTHAASDYGSTQLLAPTSSITRTMPAASAGLAGSRIEFLNTGTANATIQRAGSDNFVVNGGAQVQSIVIAPGDTLTLVSNGAALFYAVSGSAQLGYSATFKPSLGVNGYQPLAGGAILQWVTTGSVANGSSVSGSWPITFPNNCWNVTGGPTGAATNASASGFGVGKSLSGYTVYDWGAISYTSGVYLLAIGN